MASWVLVMDRVLNILKYCNKCCCNKTIEDEKESEPDSDKCCCDKTTEEKKESEQKSGSEEEKETEQGSDSEEKGKSIPMITTKKQRKQEKKMEESVIEQSTTNQNTVSPTFTINVNAAKASTPEESSDTKLPTATPLDLPSEPKHPQPFVRWVPSNYEKVSELKGEAIVGGYDITGSDLWIIRTVFESELIPAKLNYRTRQAYVAYENSEFVVHVFEVCCAPADRIKWIECSHGNVPPNAVVGGRTKSGEKLFIGRALQGSSLCPGKIQPSAGVLYVPFNSEAHAHEFYEVMCFD